MYYEVLVYILALTALVFLLSYAIYWLRKPKPIDVVYDANGTALFAVYALNGRFYVVDNTRLYRNKRITIEFRTYSDVEAFISRKFNGWNK